MQNNEPQDSQAPAREGIITVGAGMVLLAGIVLGLLLLAIGAGTRNRAVTVIGEFVFPTALFAGGLFWGQESLAVRITLLILGGLFTIAAFGNISPF
jgi:hypothetical protein